MDLLVGTYDASWIWKADGGGEPTTALIDHFALLLHKSQFE